VTDEDLRKQADVLAEIADLLPWATIEDFNRQRLTPDIITHEIHKLRASFIVPEQKKLH
jgi:hypothetical protein